MALHLGCATLAVVAELEAVEALLGADVRDHERLLAALLLPIVPRASPPVAASRHDALLALDVGALGSAGPLVGCDVLAGGGRVGGGVLLRRVHNIIHRPSRSPSRTHNSVTGNSSRVR